MVVGLQNDFTSADGKLPVNSATGYIEKIRELVPAFREHGEIFWITTQFQGKRTVNDSSGSGCMVIADDGLDLPPGSSDDEMSGHPFRPSLRSNRRTNNIAQRTMHRAVELEAEPSLSSGVDQDLFLSQDNPEDNCCIPGSWGAELSPEVRDLVSPRDVQIVKSYYSAFTSSSLLRMLRTKLITEVYVVGCTTNLSVYATALDAAQHGLTINLVEDCLNYRLKDRHERAIQKLVDIMGASVTTSSSVLSRLRGELHTDESGTEAGAGQSDVDMEDQPGFVRELHSPGELERTLKQLSLSDTSPDLAVHRQHPPLEHTEPTSPEHADTASHRLHPGSKHAGVRRCHDDAQDRSVEPKPCMMQHAAHIAQHDQPQTQSATSWPDDSSQRPVRPAPMHPDRALAQDSTGPQTQASSELEARLPRQTRQRDAETTDRTRSQQDMATNITRPARVSRKLQMRQKQLTTLGPRDDIGSDDSSITYDLLDPDLASTAFQTLFHEVHWQRMYHAAGEVPRLVCCEGDIDRSDGSMPVYRHPSDQTLPLLHWSPIVAKIRERAEKRVGHKLNHVLIQLYRGGQDHISEHSDKTLDIVRNSKIVNVSFGAQRTMRLRTKRPESVARSPDKQPIAADTGLSTLPTQINRDDHKHRDRITQRIHMPHNSMFVMGLETNATWLHGIMPDKRPEVERTSAEQSYGGMRISLTLRQIGTFISKNSKLIWGQGAVAKERDNARPTINGNSEQSQKLINAFGFENQSTTFDWDASYGAGFDVLHLKSELPEVEQPILFLSGQEHADTAVTMYLSHLRVIVEIVAPPTQQLSDDLFDADQIPLPTSNVLQRSICFRHADLLHRQVDGKVAVLEFLEDTYARNTVPPEHPQKARQKLVMSSLLTQLEHPNTAGEALQNIEKDLEEWENDDREPRLPNGWLAGPVFSIADCAVWPLVCDHRKGSPEFKIRHPRLERWAMKVQEKVGEEK